MILHDLNESHTNTFSLQCGLGLVLISISFALRCAGHGIKLSRHEA
jgi:hypothetical protein